MIDPSTWSNFNEIQTTHYFVDWLVDFATETLNGYIIHDMTVVQNTGCVVLDISPDITIEQVQDIPAGSAMNATNNDGNVPVYNNTYPVDWQVVCGDAACFKKILVIYPDQTQNTYVPGTEVSLRIDYTSAYNGTFNPNMTYAVNWVAAADTAGGKIPAVYSYCQTIGCRTLAPMQDTPAVRSSYGACLVANSSMDIYMSANKTGTFYSKYGFYKHCFYSQNKIPSYLFSFYAGDLGYLAVGTRTGVVADNAVLQSAFVDFSIANLEQILNVAENYIQLPYIWGTFNAVIMPANFPMGQMTTPMMGMMSPTVMLPFHNQAQIYTVVNSVCQSWTGMQVAPANFANFWILEGFTTFFERAVLDQLYGYDFAATEAYIGNSSLAQSNYQLGWNNTWATLNPVIQGANPNDVISEVTYEKGFQLLAYLQSLIGYAWMEDFMTYWVYNTRDIFVDGFVVRELFREFIPQAASGNATWVNEKLSMVDWEAWIYDVGTDPTMTLNFTTDMNSESVTLANGYLACNATCEPANYTEYSSWYGPMQVLFYDTLLDQIPSGQMNYAIMQQIDSNYGTTNSNNPEIMQRWYTMGLLLNYQPVFTPAENWVSSMGRLKYLKPVYQSLMDNGNTTVANDWYTANAGFYSLTAQNAISMIVTP